MAAIRSVAVVDIGKTNAKVALVDVDAGTELAVEKTPNTTLPGPLYPHVDVERLWRFILSSLARLGERHLVDAIAVTTHGAAAALVRADGSLALPVLDYEHDGPETLAAAYDAVRPDFEETGSPRLPVGLNLGAQLFWQRTHFADAFSSAAAIIPYPQYWGFRLSGVAASEVTSLGCHTDLWNPRAARFSSLVGRMDWLILMPPIRGAADSLGPILPEIAAETGLPPATPVFTGIHDSNASLIPHLLFRKPPFAVVSTGTWVVAMAVGATPRTLDPARDTLVNVDAFGRAVPSARFMGGREHALLTAGAEILPDEASVAAALAGRTLLLPSVQRGSGPYPHRAFSWTAGEPPAGERAAAVDFYLAMMTAQCLRLIGADGPVVVEGPFAANALYCSMLAAATGRAVVADDRGVTGTSIGAALLLATPRGPRRANDSKVFRPPGPVWSAYARAWTEAAGDA